MSFYARFCSLGLGVVVLLAGLGHALGWWTGAETGLVQQVRRLLFEARRTEALVQRNAAVEESLALKRAIVAELRAGRLTLHEAVRQFAEANDGIQRDDPELVGEYLKPATQEGQYLQVLRWVENEASDLSPGQVKQILEPLESAFRERFGKPARETGSWVCERNETDPSSEEPPACELLE